MEEIKDYLVVDSTSPTGLRWLRSPKQSKVKPGDPAFTSLSSKGYYNGRFRNRKYSAHRVVFYLHNGYLPEQVDHKDGNRVNNAATNLREATALTNSHNKVAKGFRKHPTTGRYEARIRADGIYRGLGSYNTPAAAHAAYLAAKRDAHPTAPERCYV